MKKTDAYAAIAQRHGYPESAKYRRVLKMLMTPFQAELVTALPGTPEEVAQKLGLDLETVREELDKLFFKGVVFPRDFTTRETRDRSVYRFARNIEQFWEASQSKWDFIPEETPEVFKAWDEFLDPDWFINNLREAAEAGKLYVRIVPAWQAIKDIPGILPQDDMREMIKASLAYGCVVLSQCSCRKMKVGAGKPCKMSRKSGYRNCLQFFRAAEYTVTRDNRPKLSYEEALAIHSEGEEEGLVHITENAVRQTMVCNCCDDCCAYLYVWNKYKPAPLEKILAKSRFEARVDSDLCNGCQICIDRCLFEAIEMQKPADSKKYKAVVDPEKCWGCGVCVLKCDPGALRLELVRPPEHLPQPVG